MRIFAKYAIAYSNITGIPNWQINFMSFYRLFGRSCCSRNIPSRKVKCFPSRMARRAALISVSLALSQTPVYTARPRIRG